MKQRGNILFLILLAVVLFAALSYAVTSSMRGGGRDIADEKAQMLASQILQYAASLNNAAQRLMLVNNCKSTEISFYNTVWRTDVGGLLTLVNNTTPNDGRCEVFGTDGGGLTAYALPASVSEGQSIPSPGATGGMPFIRSLSIVGVGTPASDTIFVLNYLNPKVCEAINKSIGLPLPTVGDSKNGWTGNYWLDNITAQLGDEDTSLQNKPYFCWKNTIDTGEPYTFAYILIER